MRTRWRGLELPTQVVLDRQVSTGAYGRLTIEPFERGFGTTVGNSLRRILLSSLEGSAVNAIKIDGVTHEFTALPGALEDITDIVLNVKSLVVRLEGDEPKTMYLKGNKAGPLTAGDIQADADITIVNKDHPNVTLSDDIEFSMEMRVEKGRGYVPATDTEQAEAEEVEIGLIPLDALFSPVTRVRYETEETRVGQKINYDRLIMEIWTDGTIGAEMALVEAAKILHKHLGPFIQYHQLGEDLASEPAELEGPAGGGAIDEELEKKLALPLAELELSVRAANCLEMASIENLGDLVSLTESQLLAMRSFGKTSLREIKRKLADLGLSLGMHASVTEDQQTQ